MKPEPRQAACQRTPACSQPEPGARCCAADVRCAVRRVATLYIHARQRSAVVTLTTLSALCHRKQLAVKHCEKFRSLDEKMGWGWEFYFVHWMKLFLRPKILSSMNNEVLARNLLNTTLVIKNSFDDEIAIYRLDETNTANFSFNTFVSRQSFLIFFYCEAAFHPKPHLPPKNHCSFS